MIKITTFGTILVIAWVFSSAGKKATDLFEGFTSGSPQIQSMNSLAFGPEGVLFIGDTKGAAVFAIETKDVVPAESSDRINIKGFDKIVASALGTDVANIEIQDMAVNPISKKIYFSVHTTGGTPALLRLDADKISGVNLTDIRYSSVSLNNAPAEDAADSRGRSLRVLTISDLGYYDGKLMVTGISNQEFSSSFRSIPFPFKGSEEMASLEIYHANHARYETNSPIRTFTSTRLNDTDYLVASYTCTPLVLFPLNELQPGKHVKGRTVGEFGFGNTPLDMITINKDDKKYLVMANSNRPVMVVDYDKLSAYKGTLTEPVDHTGGVEHFTMPWVNVLQLDKLNNDQFVMLQRRSNGDLDLWSTNARW